MPTHEVPVNASKGFYLVLIAAVAAVAVALVLPFVQFVLMAILLAYVLHPLQVRLAGRIGSVASALVLVVAATLAILIPLVGLVAWIGVRATAAVADLEPTDLGIEPIEAAIHRLTGFEIDLLDQLAGLVEGVAGRLIGTVPELLATAVHWLIGLGLAVFLLFFLLKDGDRLLAWIHRIAPLPPAVRADLVDGLDRLMWAVLVGHVAVAIVQGLLAGIGLWATGVPNVALLTAIMILLALIPLVGSFLVWAPASAWLVLTGSPVAGVALFVYGAIIVGTSDEFLRPLIVGRAAISPAVIIVGVIGGIYLLGFVGIFFGPIAVGALKVVLETYEEHREALRSSP